MRTILFPIIVSAIIAGIEIYSFRALMSRWQHYSRTYRNVLKYGHILFMSLSIIGILTLFFFGRNTSSWRLNFFFAFIIINLLTKLLFSLFLLVDDLRRLGIWTFYKIRKEKKQPNPENGISRSDFLIKTGIAVAAVPAISLPLGMVVGPYNYTLHNPVVKLPHLPAAFHGLKIVQISDIHSGSFYNKEAVNEGIDLLLEQKPDVVFFTGDLVNNKATEMANYMDVFSRVTAPMGVFSILGNHDYGDYEPWENEADKIANLDHLKAIHGELGWRLLLDEHTYLEKEGQKLGLIGVQNWGAGFHQVGDLKKAYEGCEAPVKLLLSHDPTHWDEQVRKDYKDIDITFSGHTHGAQMGIETGGFKWSPISLRYSKWAGLYQESNQYLYVNRGYGFLGYPGRIGIWPEITVMTLESGLV